MTQPVQRELHFELQTSAGSRNHLSKASQSKPRTAAEFHAHASRALLRLAPWSMRPPSIKSILPFKAPHPLFPVGAFAPALHKLAAEGNRRLFERRPPLARRGAHLRKVLCWQASQGLPDFILAKRSRNCTNKDSPGKFLPFASACHCSSPV